MHCVRNKSPRFTFNQVPHCNNYPVYACYVVRLRTPTLRVWLREALPGDEVHDGGLAGGEAQGGQSHVAVQKAAL